MIPYCREEVKRSNDFEEKRVARYNHAVADLAETKADTETEATRKGMVPVSVRYTKYFPNGIRQGIVKVMPGHWWVIATHKVPGLTYYWQEPVAIQPGEPPKSCSTRITPCLLKGRGSQFVHNHLHGRLRLQLAAQSLNGDLAHSRSQCGEIIAVVIVSA